MMKKTLGACATFALALSLVAGETVTVDNVTDLTNHLDRLNRLNTAAFDKDGYNGNRHDTVILRKGFYDVSGCAMLCSTEKKGLDYAGSFSHIAVAFENCVLEGCGTEKSESPDVALRHIGPYNDPTDGVVFSNVTVRQAVARDWIDRDNVPENITAPIRNIGGDVTVAAPGRGTRRLTLDAGWCARTYPQKAVVPTHPRKAFGGVAEVVDTCPGEPVELTALRARGIGIWLFHAPAAGTYRFDCRLQPLDNPPAPRYHPLVVRAFPSDAKICEIALKDPQLSAFDVKVPRAGFYRLIAEIGQRYSFRLVRSALPVAYYAQSDAQALWSSVGSLWFHVPAGAGFSLMPTGSDGERVSASVSDPSGAEVWSETAIGAWARFQPESPAEGLWRVEIRRPGGKYMMDDFKVDLTGLPGVLFLSDRKYWKE